MAEGAAVSVEDQALLEGQPRIKFACKAADAPLEKELSGELLKGFDSLVEPLADALVLLEETGAAPLAPDGAVAGNCAALLEASTGEAAEVLMVSKSGKDAGKRPTRAEFVAVQRFRTEGWGCDFCPAAAGSRPTSDTPLHWACLATAAKELGWRQRPRVVLHGHALAEAGEAEALGLPISAEETLFSTPDDVAALMALLRRCPYPEHRVYVRRGHGFLILAETAGEAVAELRRLEPHFKRPAAAATTAPTPTASTQEEPASKRQRTGDAAA